MQAELDGSDEYSVVGHEGVSMRRTSRRAAVILSLSALAATTAACGSSGGTSSGHGGTITIGILHPFTGNYAGVGAASLAGAKVAAKLINDAGGVLGKTLKIVTADTLGDPADAVPALNKLLNIDHVSAVVGPGGLESGSTIPVLDRNHIPFMLQAGDTAFDTMSDQYGFRTNPSDSQLSVAMAQFAHDKGYKTAAMVFSTIESAQTLKAPIEKTFKKLGGKIVADVSLTPAQTSYSSEVLKVNDAHPDVIFTQMEPPTGSVFFNAMAQTNNLSIPFIGSDITAGSDFISAVTTARASKALYSLEGSSPANGAGSIFTKEYKVLEKATPLSNANYAYDATIVLALAIDAAKSTKGADIAAAISKVSSPPGTTVQSYAAGLKALKAGKDINYDGASGPMDLDSHHNVYGPFQVVQSDAKGNPTVVASLSAKELEADSAP
ncbi:ABC transporter substrate-binding protein [Mycobacterium sp.]|uniref:ABC transporter substrate-binding protein n=1 Tax=Mycobacterium sp. TaxID=1785 RepID=UPI0028BD2ED5|nr:ABC transporter substrate-binding protein [Mycobacterium sp.]